MTSRRRMQFQPTC